MPQVFTNDMVSHVWAQQSQQSGRSANGQFYFEGPFLYSYGTHYVAGLFAAVGGPVFINTTGYSVTTNRHTSRAWGAARHLSPWGLPELTAIARELREAGQDRLSEGERKRLVAYLSAHWQSLAPDSEAAAWILAKAGKRGTWAAMRARLERAKAKADAADKARAKAHAIREGRMWAALPWPEVRDRLNRDFEGTRYRAGLRDTLAGIRAARLATPKAHKRVRATLAIAAELEPVRDEYRTEAERERAAARQAERERQQRFAAMSADELRAAFEAGELRARDSILWSVTRETGPLLRAVAPEVSGCSVTGGTLETSEGATVPLRHAFRVFQFVALCRAERKAWTPGCGFGPGRIRVGHFTLDRIESTGNFVAGCHSIKWPEVERLARGLGVADCLAPVAEVTAELAGQAA